MGISSEGQSQEQQLNLPPSIFRPQQQGSSAGETPDVCFVFIETSHVQNRLAKRMQHACIEGSGPKRKTMPWSERVKDAPKASLLTGRLSIGQLGGLFLKVCCNAPNSQVRKRVMKE